MLVLIKTGQPKPSKGQRCSMQRVIAVIPTVLKCIDSKELTQVQMMKQKLAMRLIFSSHDENGARNENGAIHTSSDVMMAAYHYSRRVSVS